MTHHRPTARFFFSVFATAVLCLLIICLHPAPAVAEGTVGIDQILGVDRATFVANMEANAARYLGTPYTYYADRMDGPGQHMDCSAFVGFALVEQGGVDDALWRSYAISGEASVGYPGTESIDKMFRSQGAANLTFGSVDEVLASGYATKGDIIFVWPQDFGDAPLNGGRSHVGFFWGDSPSDNKMWHSTHSDGLSGNVISDIRGKVGGSLYYRVYKTTSTGSIDLTKTSADASYTQDNLAYSLAGTVFGIYRADGTEACRIITDAQGHARADGLTFGMYTVRELQAPTGYVLNQTAHAVIVGEDDAVLEVHDAPAKLDLTIQKTDRETGSTNPLGNATLEGAVYRVTYPWQGTAKQCELVTDAQGHARLDGIPLGTIQIQELSAPKGYLLDDTVHTYTVAGDASGSALYRLDTEGDLSEQAIRGDIELVKIGAHSHKRLAAVPFKITSATTGESHTFVTDDNGYASTAAAWNSHVRSTNEGGTDLDGIWFGTENPDDALGALPFDTYSIEELPCEANEDNALIPTFTITVSRDSHTIDLGTLTDDILPHMAVSKVDATTGRELPGASMQLVDATGAVLESWTSTAEAHTINGLKPGNYVIHENAAPAGYDVTTDIPFTLLDTMEVQKCIMADWPKPAPQKLPATLDMLRSSVPACAATAAAATAVVFFARRKVRRDRLRQKMLSSLRR